MKNDNESPPKVDGHDDNLTQHLSNLAKPTKREEELKTKVKRKTSMEANDVSDLVDETLSLNDAQELFCKCMADGHSQTRAASIAYPSDTHQKQRGYELMQTPKIAARVEQLKKERAWAAKLIDPQISMVRWNQIYLDAQERGDIKTMVEAQKQIDKINGAEAAIVKQQLEVKGLFTGETEEEWKETSKNLLNIVRINHQPSKNNNKD